MDFKKLFNNSSNTINNFSNIEREIIINSLNEKKQDNLLSEEHKFIKDRLQTVFQDYLVGITISDETGDSNQLEYNIFLDESDYQEGSREDLKIKLHQMVENEFKKKLNEFRIRIIFLTEIWSSFFTKEYTIRDLIIKSKVIYDNGIILAIKLSEMHKEMVLQQFKESVLFYSLNGSVINNKQTPRSDVDTMIIFSDSQLGMNYDDNLKKRLKSTINYLALRTEEIIGVKGLLNIQIFSFAEIIENLNSGSPVILSYIKNSVPLYDIGILESFKKLIIEGKIKGDYEAMLVYLRMGDELIEIVNKKFSSIVVEDIYWAMISVTQALLMLYDVRELSPISLIEYLNEIVVKKENKLDYHYVFTLEKIIKMRKEIQGFNKKQITGEELDQLLKEVRKYINKIKIIFAEVVQRKHIDELNNNFELMKSLLIKYLEAKGYKKASQIDIDKFLESEEKYDYLPLNYLHLLQNVNKAVKIINASKYTEIYIYAINIDALKLISFLKETNV